MSESVGGGDGDDDNDSHKMLNDIVMQDESYRSSNEPRHQHLDFLDLTNGAGGEGMVDINTAGVGAPSGGRTSGSSKAQQRRSQATDEAVLMMTASASNDEETDDDDDDEDGGGGGSRPSSGKKGNVVEEGQEHTGRWTKQEHEAFLAGLQIYGKEWKKVAAMVKTRTVVQTRTHAQKYFQKLQKTVDGSSGAVAVGDGDMFPQVDMNVSSGEKKPRASSSQQPRKKRAANKQNRRSSNTTMSAAQVISSLAQAGTTTGGAVAHEHVPTSSRFMSSYKTDGGGGPTSFQSWMSSQGGGSMRISAPDPESSMRKHGFPEPSPAATGKRRLAEIAAARMLAGVGSGGGSGGGGGSTTESDGPPTPPPPATVPAYGDMSLNMKEAPHLPLSKLHDGDGAALYECKSLQIVNPDSLGVSYSSRHSGNSPTTPWDGQLEALISEKATSQIDQDDDRDLPLAMPTTLPPVCGPASVYHRTPLHRAVCNLDLDSLTELLNPLPASSDDQAAKTEDPDVSSIPSKPPDLDKLDDVGYAPIHSACSMRLSSSEKSALAGQIVRMLLDAGCKAHVADAKGNMPLHWACRAADKEVVDMLLSRTGCSLEAKNADGETALHWAMRAGRPAMECVGILIESGARSVSLNKWFRCPLDVAADGFGDDPGSFAALKIKQPKSLGKKLSRDYRRAQKITAADRLDTRANMLIRSPQSRTLVLHHHECLEHHTKSEADWEAPDRIMSIMKRILPSSDPTGVTETSGIFPHEVSVSKEFERAKLEFLSRVHSTEYLSFVNKLSKDLEKNVRDSGESSGGEESDFSPSVVPFTPLVQRSMIKVADNSIKLGINSDTSFSAGSLRAARRAAGAVQHAVDCVLVGRNKNAFCVVRPPGHHAGVSGLLDGGESCGFCIFNNVAAGALYAISDDRLLCDKCAIVDFDAHHGNGTEEICRKLHDPSKLLFFSIHLYDNDKRKRSASQYMYKFYPGTGSEDDLALNIINVPIVPLWRDPTAPSAASRKHNTRNNKGTARSSNDSTPEDGSDTAMNNASSRGGGSDAGSEAGGSNQGMALPPSGTLTPPPPVSGPAISGRGAYRQAIQTRLLPALRAFNPDLILISAGFDAARGDVGNARHERGGEKMGIDLEPDDYAWTTRKILEVADICCQGRVVSVLEGGYGRTAPAYGDGHALDRTMFAECAIRHLHAMIDPYDTEGRFG